MPAINAYSRLRWSLAKSPRLQQPADNFILLLRSNIPSRKDDLGPGLFDSLAKFTALIERRVAEDPTIGLLAFVGGEVPRQEQRGIRVAGVLDYRHRSVQICAHLLWDHYA